MSYSDLTRGDLPRSQALFTEALALPMDARRSFLESACADSPSLREEVWELIQLSEGTAGVLDEPLIEQLLPASEAPLKPGDQLGSYTILNLLGEGGMGRVYRAQQESPRREVAIKVIQDLLISPEARRRFSQEASVLGRLQHVGIASVIEASLGGTRPFIVMEIVEGTPITRAAKGVSVRKKLEMVAKICEALHHAHVKGVIHRDIKPGNILVDAQFEPHILDFGIARLSQTESGVTMTGAGQLVGTLSYMSPEQAGPDPSRVDARSDVYSLGAVLYELLCDRPPLELSESAIADSVARIQREEPPLPRSLDREIPPDVETIILRALEKDPLRRYQHASDLGDDIRRFLADQPILARRATAIYQLTKFATRNRVLVSVVAAACMLICVALVVVTAALVETKRAEAEAVKQADLARQEAERAQRFAKYLREMLSLDAEVIRNGDTTLLREMLKSAEARLFTLESDPLTQTAILGVIGNAYRDYGLHADSGRVLEQVVEQSERLKGPEHLDTLFAKDALGATLLMLKIIDRAEPMLRSVAEARERLGDVESRQITTLQNLGIAQVYSNKLEEALVTFSKAQELAEQTGSDQSVIGAASERATVLSELGRHEESVALARTVYEKSISTLGIDHLRTSKSSISYARILLKAGDLAKAEEILQGSIAREKAKNGTVPQDLLGLVEQLVRVSVAREDWPKALSGSLELLAGLEEAGGPDSLMVFGTHSNIAYLLKEMNEFDRAVEHAKTAFTGIERLYPEGHQFTAQLGLTYATALGDLHRVEEQIAILERVHAVVVSEKYNSPEAAAEAAKELHKAYDGLNQTERAEFWKQRAETPPP